MHHCLGIPPVVTAPPQMLAGAAIAAKRVVRVIRKSHEHPLQEDEIAAVQTLRSEMNEGMHAVYQLGMKSENWTEKAEEIFREETANTHTFLVHFGKKERRIANTSEAWRTFFAEIAMRMGVLDTVLERRPMSITHRTGADIFYDHLAEWMEQETLRWAQR